MKLKTTLVAILCLAIISCGKKKPTACFTFSKEYVKVGDTLTLINCSKNFTDVQWSLPNGAGTKVVNPRVKMQSAGLYQATLTVGLNGFENSNFVSKEINVLP